MPTWQNSSLWESDCMKKKIKKDGIYFLGEAANDVTGSQYLVRFGNYQCLLECGLHQSRSNDYLDSYRINNEKFKFKPSDIDYVFIAHAHIDHCGLLPKLVKEGFNGRIIATAETAAIMKSLLLNCAFIVQDEAKVLSKRYKKNYKPLYDEEDVFRTIDLVKTYDKYNIIYSLNDNIQFQWIDNSHCVGAAQLQLILKNKIRTKKILYTSDIGALNTRNHYVRNTAIPEQFSDITIMESTYGNKSRFSKRTRDFDLEHFKTAIETVIERKGSIILPCFSFNRTQEILTNLYEMYKDDKDFKIPIIIDSVLSCEISDLYTDILFGKDLSLWNKVRSWDNVYFITDKEKSKEIIEDNTPKIVISSSGFCTNGRIVNYLKKYLADRNSMIIFSGYVGDNPSYLSYRIKNYYGHKTIKINKEDIPNKADCITLSTFSSHANYNDLIMYGSSLNTNKLVLVHGEKDSKTCLAKALQDKISENNKTYKVIVSNKGMAIHFGG